jgi:hypothetical protein
LPGSYIATADYSERSALVAALSRDGQAAVVAQADIADVAVAVLT